MTGTLGIGLLYIADETTSTAARIITFVPMVESFTRLATLRVFEITYRLYTLPL
jgi:hypothetical protein